MVGVIVRSVIIGGVAGWLAGKIMRKEGSVMRNIILGFAGSVVGSIVFGLIGLAGTNIIGEIIVSVVGACIVIGVAGMLIK
ncbi:MAG: GlsB/YeaQ/YmgE family stress response membrane protein [Lachnospiraceae bacterium]|nr:GlsB/YeaQ/YmgE family stress response membrane protein [Lachnospiraceae bacterium]